MQNVVGVLKMQVVMKRFLFSIILGALVACATFIFFRYNIRVCLRYVQEKTTENTEAARTQVFSKIDEETKKLITATIEQLKNHHYEVRGKAAEKLGEIGHPYAVQALIQALNDRYFFVLRAVVKALGNIGDKSAIKPLQNLFDKIDRINMTILKLDIAKALIRMNCSNKVSIVKFIINSTEDSDIYARRLAVSYLGELRVKSAVPALIRALAYVDEIVQIKTIEALTLIGDKSAKPALIRLLGEGKINVRISAATALYRLGSNAGFPVLIEAANDDDVWIRKSAVAALAETGDKSAIQVLLDALQDKWQIIRSIAVTALCKTNGGFA